jgi:hypothetical protein
MTVADDIRLLRFQVADDLVNTLVCHHVWRIVPGTDIQSEVDRAAGFGFRICKIFLDFAATVIMRYVERNALFTA